MPDSLDREQAVVTLEEGWATLSQLLGRLDETQMQAQSKIGDHWSAKDLLGHIAFWENLALESMDDWRSRRPPRVHDVFRKSGGVDDINAADIERTRGMSMDDVRRNAEETHARLLERLAATSDEEWNEEPFYEIDEKYRRSFGELLAGVVGAPQGGFTHVQAHLADLTRYVEEVGTT